LEVLATLPREAFVPEIHRALAYADVEIPLGHGQRMMKPVVEGRTLQGLLLQPGEEVLEIGTGGGYLAACMGALAREVVSLEIHADLAATARARLAAQNVLNAQVIQADALNYSTDRRFNAICVTGAVYQIPQQWLQWLQPGGRLFVMRGRSPAMEGIVVTASAERNEVNASRIQSLFETDLPYLEGAAPAPAFEF
jgi:protein-L-isoaspartate(D-aspartate) O-methyltransferase